MSSRKCNDMVAADETLLLASTIPLSYHHRFVCFRLRTYCLTETLFTRYNRLSNGLSNRLYNWTAGCTMTTGWIFVYTIQPLVQPLVKPVWQPVVSCKRRFNIRKDVIACIWTAALAHPEISPWRPYASRASATNDWRMIRNVLPCRWDKSFSVIRKLHSRRRATNGCSYDILLN